VTIHVTRKDDGLRDDAVLRGFELFIVNQVGLTEGTTMDFACLDRVFLVQAVVVLLPLLVRCITDEYTLARGKREHADEVTHTFAQRMTDLGFN
jgi:hypothetical protein